jgi:purine-binding chemotaxis protein CheW
MEKSNMEQKKLEQFLCVKIGGRWLGVDATRILEIINPASSDSPGTQFKDDGKTIQYHGKILPTIHLADVLLGAGTHYETSQRILISETGEKMAGLIVDSAEEIIRIPKEKLSLLDASRSDMNAESLEGIIETDEKTINVLSLDKLYQLAGVV